MLLPSASVFSERIDPVVGPQTISAILGELALKCSSRVYHWSSGPSVTQSRPAIYVFRL